MILLFLQLATYGHFGIAGIEPECKTTPVNGVAARCHANSALSLAC